MVLKLLRGIFLITYVLFIYSASVNCNHEKARQCDHSVNGHYVAKEYYCPGYTECDTCPRDWIYPDIKRTGVSNFDGTCDVTFYWDWEYNLVTGDNPLLVFNCQYPNGNPCSIGVENRCGSCQNNTLPGIDISSNPTVTYSDSCGNTAEILITEPCEGPTYPTIITTDTTTWLSTTTTPTEAITTRLTTDQAITTAPPDCPPFNECSGCPLDWIPHFSYTGTPSETAGLCNIKISWAWDYSTGSVDNPSLDFICIYGANGEYCQTPKSACGSCETITFEDLDLSLNPYINYLDTCSNSDLVYLGDDCNELTSVPGETTKHAIASTTSVPGNCPDLGQCTGCPGSFQPAITQEGTIVSPDNCTVNIRWDWPYNNDEQNLRMVYICRYASGFHCQPLDEEVCGSCEKFTIANIKPSEQPVIEYSDTCGNILTYTLTNDCYA